MRFLNVCLWRMLELKGGFEMEVICPAAGYMSCHRMLDTQWWPLPHSGTEMLLCVCVHRMPGLLGSHGRAVCKQRSDE